MALKEFEFGFGKTTQKVSLPEEHILDVLEGAPTPACDVKAATLECMRHPIGSKPLTEIVSKGDKVCIVCADVTRIWNHSDQYVIHIVNELNRGGIPDDDICILFAQGTHREQTPEEDIAVVGEELTHRVKLYQHRCKQMDELVHVGDTKRGTPVWLNKHAVEADKIIVVDGIPPHLFAGYGGGRKLILPGVAGDETIQINHCHALGEKFGSGINPKTRSTLLDDNPVSDDMQEASDMVKPAFLVHSVINSEGQICRMVGGDPYEAWLEGTKETYRLQKVPMKQQADVTIVSAGGYPKDTNLYQGTKCYSTAEIATKKGGIIITMIEAEDIMEPAAYLGSFKYKNLVDMEKGLRDCFTIPFFVAFENLNTALTHTVYIVTRPENFDILREKTHQIPVATVEEAWQLAQKQLEGEGKTDYAINIIPHGSAVVPYLKK